MKDQTKNTLKALMANNRAQKNIVNVNNVPSVVNEQTINIVNKIFAQLEIIYPMWKVHWKNSKNLDLAKGEWTKALMQSRINSIEQLRLGFEKARKDISDFPPSCGKFVGWCKHSPESIGWPDTYQALKKCENHRTMSKLFTGSQIKTRPVIIELCKMIDWQMLSAVTNSEQRKNADDHFAKKYNDLFESGYSEPVATDHQRLETPEVVKANMSKEQKSDARQRGLNVLYEIKAKIKTNKMKNKL